MDRDELISAIETARQRAHDTGVDTKVIECLQYGLSHGGRKVPSDEAEILDRLERIEEQLLLSQEKAAIEYMRARDLEFIAGRIVTRELAEDMGRDKIASMLHVGGV